MSDNAVTFDTLALMALCLAAGWLVGWIAGRMSP